MKTIGQRGLSILELMVALAIGLIIVLATTGVMMRSEAGKRTTTSTNDMNQVATYLAYTLDRSVRSAGSGYVQRWQQVFGCQMHAVRSGGTMLPRPGAWPAPFTTLPTSPRIAPAVIFAGASDGGSDVLAVMTGNAGYSESGSAVLPGSVTASDLRLRNTLGFNSNDLVLLYDDTAGCVLQQVQSPFTGSTSQTLPFGGTYSGGEVDGVNLTSLGLGNTMYTIAIGNVVTENQPQFQYFGVGASNTLFSYDLLQLGTSDASLPMADGVVELRALYGVDTNDDGMVDSWESPATSPWTAAELLDGTSAAQLNLRRIMAIRIGLVLRSSLMEKDVVSPSSLTLFSDLPISVQYTHTVTATEQKSRHRTVEVTVPLRNLLLLP